jgi:peptidoglycan/xylan/chitin deacetylase (PgdA/CDA1 family)
MEAILSIRVDVDTSVGLQKGVPELLRIFSEYGIWVSIFVVMGPDTMGVHMKRFSQKDYLKRILKVNPFKLIKRYGIKPFFYGTLLSSPDIGSAYRDLLVEIATQGHEIGIHGYNHANWADHYQDLNEAETRSEFTKAFMLYQDIFKEPPLGSAAPNWRCNQNLLKVETELKLKYASDTRGSIPFWPVIQNHIFPILQIPTTLPATHECLQAGKANKSTVISAIVEKIKPGLNVWTIHDWFEGLSEPQMVREFMERSLKKGYRFMRLRDIAEEILKKENQIPRHPVISGKVEGGIGEVSCQGYV